LNVFQRLLEFLTFACFRRIFSLSFSVQSSFLNPSSNHTLLLGKTSAKFTKVTSAVVSVMTLPVVAATGNQRDTN
jgi:hypothetical protein